MDSDFFFFLTEWKEEVAVDQVGVRECVWSNYNKHALFEISKHS